MKRWQRNRWEQWIAAALSDELALRLFRCRFGFYLRRTHQTDRVIIVFRHHCYVTSQCYTEGYDSYTCYIWSLIWWWRRYASLLPRLLSHASQLYYARFSGSAQTKERNFHCKTVTLLSYQIMKITMWCVVIWAVSNVYRYRSFSWRISKDVKKNRGSKVRNPYLGVLSMRKLVSFSYSPLLSHAFMRTLRRWRRDSYCWKEM